MKCSAEYCDHPECHGLTNLNTEAEQIVIDYRKGEKIKIGLVQLEKIVGLYIDLSARKGDVNRGYDGTNAYSRRKYLAEYMKKYTPKYNAKKRYIRNRERAFAYRWTLQIEWLTNEYT